MSTRANTVVGTALVALALGAGGCAMRGAALESLERYPQAPQTRTVDVQVERDGTRLVLVNTSGQTLEGRVWVNRWFSSALAPVAPGARASLDLHAFKDTFGNAFRAGGFFAIERPDPVVQTQVQLPSGELVGLVTLGQGRTGVR
jgi:hypothetical protein